MNSENKTNKIKQLLDASTTELSPAVLESLRASRKLALDHQRTRRSPVLNWVYAHTGLPVANPATRPANMALASIFLVVLLLGGYSYIQNYLNERDITEVDIAILTDDLPLNVYVD
jgi:hypothetical protein